MTLAKLVSLCKESKYTCNLKSALTAFPCCPLWRMKPETRNRKQFHQRTICRLKTIRYERDSQIIALDIIREESMNAGPTGTITKMV